MPAIEELYVITKINIAAADLWDMAAADLWDMAGHFSTVLGVSNLDN